MLLLGVSQGYRTGSPPEVLHGNLAPLATSSPSAVVRIGDYEILEEIGHGGMGLVYRALHLGLNRIVALKLLLHGPFANSEMLSRFRREAQSAAALAHPGIVPLYEVGESNGQSFIAMEFVAGRGLDQIIRELGARSSEFSTIARWVKDIAEAIAHAHARGIVHRDLKPANILLDAEDRVRVLDFGLARRLDDVSDLTLTGQVLGSPDYLAPEQAAGTLATPLPASDIYALGAVLYELLTGQPPFRSSSVQDTLLRIRDAEPIAPRSLNGSAPRDLEVVCLKCLEKDPARRYSSARDLAEDLDRFLNGSPIRARPIGITGKAWRWCRRKPALAGLGAAVVTLLLTVTAVSVVSASRIASARKSEQREAYYSYIALADKLIQEGSIERALEALWRCPQEYRHWEWGHLLYLCHQEVASFQAHAARITAASFSPDNRWAVSQDSTGTAKVWDWEAEQEVFAFGSASDPAGWISFHPWGDRLAAAMGTNGVTVWMTSNWQPTVTPSPTGTKIDSLAYSPDGLHLVTGGADGTLTIWDSTTGQSLRALTVTTLPLRRVAFSSKGDRVVAVGEGAAWVFEWASGKLIRAFPNDFCDAGSYAHYSGIEVFVDDNGEIFATIDLGGQLSLWRPGRAPQELIKIRGAHPRRVRSVFFSPDGRWMVNGGEENTARVWDLATGAEHFAIPERVVSVSFSRDGGRMATSGAMRWITTWDLAQGRELKTLRGHISVAGCASMSSDGRLVVSAEESGIVKVWSAGLGREFAQDRAWHHVSTFSPDGRLLASCPYREGIVIRSVRSGRELLRIHTPNEFFTDAVFSPDSRRLVTVGSSKAAKVWDVETGALSLRLSGHRRSVVYGVGCSPDGRWIAAGGLDGSVILWDARTGEPHRSLFIDPAQGHTLVGESNRVMWVVFDDTGERLATGTPDGKARIWQVQSGKLLNSLDAEGPNIVPAPRFLPDRRLFLTCGRVVRIWDLRTGHVIREAPARGEVSYLSVTRDGRRLIVSSDEHGGNFAGSSHGLIEVWDIEHVPRRTLERRGREHFPWVEFSPDDRTVAGATDYSTYRWESFPWRRADYAPDPDQEPGVQKRRTKWVDARRRPLLADWQEQVRQYARSYWLYRLALEFEGPIDEPSEPRIIQVPMNRALFGDRPLQATNRQVDLTDFYTGELGELLFGKVPFTRDADDNLSALPVGLVELGGVEFDVRGVIQRKRQGECILFNRVEAFMMGG